MRIWFSFSALLLGSQVIPSKVGAANLNSAPATAADSCGPSYRDIYEFQVGDVFQYSSSTWTSGGGGENRNHFDGKYTVVSKETLAAGFRYQIAGLTRKWVFPFAPNMTYGKTNESWEFADGGTRNALNACQDSMARFLQFGPGIYPFLSVIRTYYTRMQIKFQDYVNFPLSISNLHVKILGGDILGVPGNNLFLDSAGKTESEDRYSSIYAASLGMVSASYTLFESGGDFSMTGYTRNGVTHGKVEADTAFGQPLALRLAPSGGGGSGDASHLTTNGSFLLSRGGARMRNLIGRQVHALPDHHFIH